MVIGHDEKGNCPRWNLEGVTVANKSTNAPPVLFPCGEEGRGEQRGLGKGGGGGGAALGNMPVLPSEHWEQSAANNINVDPASRGLISDWLMRHLVAALPPISFPCLISPYSVRSHQICNPIYSLLLHSHRPVVCPCGPRP